jgi:hypothetical protein
MPAPQAAGDVFVTVAVVPEVHILPPTFVNGLMGFGVVIVEHTLTPSSQSLYIKNDP